jgi:DNA topoisomerase-3
MNPDAPTPLAAPTAVAPSLSKPASAPDCAGQPSLGSCPKCGARVFDAGASYACEKALGPNAACTFQTGKAILQRPIEAAQITKLLAGGGTDWLEGFVSKKSGRKFEARLVLQEGKVAFEFPPPASGPAAPRRTAARQVPSSSEVAGGAESAGRCPKCGARVIESADQYRCEHAERTPHPCGFKAGRTILGQVVPREQFAKLLSTGRTDLISGFVSRKTGREFRAYLTLQEDGRVAFEFPPREGRPG